MEAQTVQKQPRKPRDSAPGLTRLELAAELGHSVRTIGKWEREGLPVLARGRGGQPSTYSQADVRRWLEARRRRLRSDQEALTAARTRRELAMARLGEQQHAVRSGKLLPIEDVDRLWSGQVAAIRARLLAIPIALADRVHRIAAIEGPAGVERVLQDAVYEALRELAEGNAPAKRSAARTRTTRPKSRRPRPRRQVAR